MKSKESVTLDVHGLSIKISYEPSFKGTARRLIGIYSFFKSCEEGSNADIDLNFTSFDPKIKGMTSCFAYVPRTSFHGGRFYWNNNGVIFRREGIVFKFAESENLAVDIDTRNTKAADQIMRFALARKFAARDLAFVHSAAVSKQDHGIMLAGWGHTGKTSIALNMVEDSFDFLGDDVVLISKRKSMLSFPVSALIFGYDLEMCSFLKNRKNKRVEAIKSGKDFENYRKQVPIFELIDRSKIGRETRISKVILLNKWEKKDIALFKSNSVSKRIFMQSTNELAYLYSLGNVFDYIKYCKHGDEEQTSTFYSNTWEIISTALSNLDSYEMCIPENPIPIRNVVRKLEEFSF